MNNNIEKVIFPKNNRVDICKFIMMILVYTVLV